MECNLLIISVMAELYARINVLKTIITIESKNENHTIMTSLFWLF
jgi:DNA-directed RNA polymerase subunit L